MKFIRRWQELVIMAALLAVTTPFAPSWMVVAWATICTFWAYGTAKWRHVAEQWQEVSAEQRKLVDQLVQREQCRKKADLN